MIIAIDGPAGAGKSTIAKLVAQRLSMIYIDTGAMYRAFTYELIKNSVSVDDLNAVLTTLENTNIDFKDNKILINNEDVSDKIRSKEVTSKVSEVSAIMEVRVKLVSMQRSIANKKDSVLDGRDIGTVVFPFADLKIYLTASVNVRAVRRYNEISPYDKSADIREIEKSIEQRDFYDSNREVSPLKKADDAFEIDTSNLTINEVVENILELTKEIIEKEIEKNSYRNTKTNIL